MAATDKQEGGNHYKEMAIQPVEFIHKNNIPFIEGCVIKYVCRHKRKNGLEDLKKAIHFLEMLIEMEYPETKQSEFPREVLDTMIKNIRPIPPAAEAFLAQL